MRRRSLVSLSLVVALLALGAGLVLWQAVKLTSLSRVSDEVARIKPIADATRLVLIGLLAVLWPKLVDLAHRLGRTDERSRARWRYLRWRVVGWLLVIELILGQNLLGRVVAAAIATDA